MEVQLAPDQEALVRQAIENGRLHHAEEAVQQALSLWETRERSRIEILCALDEAESDLNAGKFLDYTEESLARLGEELKREARATFSSGSKGWPTA
jgi:Arc/MetJ-type ribon-helix-helix transcriptional regulator